MHHLIRFGPENIPAGTVFSPNPVTAQRNEREEEENKPERSIKFFNLILRIVSVIAFAVELLADPSIKPYASKTLEILCGTGVPGFESADLCHGASVPFRLIAAR
jgi:hypothetical protein